MPIDSRSPRLVGTLWCTDVMARLPDLLDGTLSTTDRAALEAHVRGCDWCERFGGEYAGAARALRAWSTERVPPDVAARLDEVLGLPH
jgi:anti-sigma factor RsiW